MNLIKLKKQKKIVDRESSYYRMNKCIFNFQNFQTLSTFGGDIYNGKITIAEADEDQSYFSVEILNFKEKAKLESPEKKQQKEDALENFYNLFKRRERLLNAFESKTFPINILISKYLLLNKCFKD